MQQPTISLGRRNSYEVSQMGDNTYATILPRNTNSDLAGTIRTQRMRNSSFVSTIGTGDMADYATLRNVSRTPPSAVRGNSMRFFQFFALVPLDMCHFHDLFPRFRRCIVISRFFSIFLDSIVRIHRVNIPGTRTQRRQFIRGRDHLTRIQ